MGFLGGLAIFIIIAGLIGAIVTNYLGLYTIPGQCKAMCPECHGVDDSGASGASDKKQTTKMSYQMF